MREHDLKCWPTFWDEVDRGEKTFEVRVNDRDYAVGDILVLKKWDPHKETYVTVDGLPYAMGHRAQTLRRKVTSILHGGRFGLPEHVCVMSIPIDPEDTP